MVLEPTIINEPSESRSVDNPMPKVQSLVQTPLLVERLVSKAPEKVPILRPTFWE